MKINFNDYNLDGFKETYIEFCQIPAILITPNNIGVKFTHRTKIFRSSIWDLNGQLLSGGFCKFVNFLENPENFPVPKSINGCKITDKIDGSLNIVDFVNGKLSMRTRGTSTYKTMENFEDFEKCLSKYPNIEKWIRLNSNYSLLFEITTPNLKIVLDYGQDTDFTLIGAVNKYDYSLMTQSDLDTLSTIIGVKRPKYYTFNSLPELLIVVQEMNGVEGVCLYSNNDQTIHKIKTEEYLKLHRFKSHATFESTVDLFFEFGMPEYGEFQTKLIEKFDWECAKMVLGFTSIICDGMKEVNKLVDAMKVRVEPLKLLSRKDAADTILQKWGDTSRSGMCFQILSGKELKKEDLKKLLWQVTKN